MADLVTNRPRLPMAVVVGEFPSLSETFILRELDALQAAGLNPRLYALRPGDASVQHARTHRWMPKVRYLAPPASLSGKPLSDWEPLRCNRVGGYCLLSLMARTGLRFPGLWLRVIKHRRAIAALVRAVDEDHIGYIQAHFATLPTEIAWAASLYSGCPFGFSTHAHDIYTQSPALLRQKIEHAVFVSGCTETHVRTLRQLVWPPCREKIKRFYHGTPIPARDPSRSPRTGHILAVGRFVPKKAFDILVAACDILVKRGVEVTCDLVGDGPERPRLTDQIHAAGLEKHVIMRGAVNQESLQHDYRHAMLAVVTSRILPNGDRDGIPNVLLEAMARGLPVIASDTPAIREVIRHQHNGWLVAPDQPGLLADAIEKLITDKSRREHIGQQAAATVRRDFDAERHARDLVAFYRAFLETGGKSGDRRDAEP